MSGNSTLLAKAVRAAAWGYAGTAIKLVMQLGVQIMLARILGPAEYGVFAIGVIVVAFALYFGDVASSALIPRNEISSEQTRFAFTWQLLVSGLVTGIIFLLATPIAGFVNEPKAAFVLQALSFVCVLNAVGGVGLAILRRRLDYKMIQVAQVAGYFAGYVLVALPWALWWEPSVSALVAAWLVQVLVTSVIFLIAAPHSLVPKFVCNDGKQLLLFGWHSLLSNLGGWAISNIDRIVVVKSFPVAQVGLYTTSANLLSTPLSQLYGTLQSVTFSASARLDDANDRVAGIFVSLVLLATFVGGFVYGFTFATADLLVTVLYGVKWLDAVPYVSAFSIAMFFNALSGVVTPLIWSKGSVRKDAFVQIVVAVMVSVGAVMLISYSALAVAWWMAACSGVRAILILFAGIGIFKNKINELFNSMVRIVLIIFLLVVSIAFVKNFITYLELNAITAWLVTMIVPCFYVFLVFRYRVFFGKSFDSIICKVINRMPRRVSCFLS